MAGRSLSHLQQLEAESIQIIREVAAEFGNPVMMYSIGKDSSVMLHLARKAFYPGKIPFPLLHVDTGWKFKEMIAFRDAQAKAFGFELLTHTNQEGVEQGVGPFTHGSAKHTDIMKTQGLKQALNKYGFDAHDVTKKSLVPKSGYIRSVISTIVGTLKTNVQSYGAPIMARSIKARAFECSLYLTGLSSIFGSTSIKKILKSYRYILQPLVL